MTAKKGKQLDWRNFIIGLLLVVVTVETYLLYKSNPDGFTSLLFRREETVEAKKPAKLVPLEKRRLKPQPTEPQPTPAPFVPPVASVKGAAAKVAFIIDDWGYTTKNCQYLREIKSPITIAVLPNLPHSKDVMQCAHDSGKEIMLHLPMEPHKNPDHYPQDYILKTTMTPIKVDHLLSNILDQMPYVEGVNNHMGSKATEDRMLMTTVFKQLRHRNLFFVDSRSTGKSVCAPLAREIGLPFTYRDVFLDNVNERTAIQNQLVTLVKIAKKKGWAVAIGHDRSLTLQVIQDRLGWLKEQGIELVTVKNIIGQ